MSHFVALLKSDLIVQQTYLKPCLSLTLAAQLSVTKPVTMSVLNLVPSKAAAKLKLLFNNPASGP